MARYQQVICTLVILVGATIGILAIGQGWTTGLAYAGLVLVGVGSFPFVVQLDEYLYPSEDRSPHPR